MFHIIKYARCKNLPVSSSRGYHTIPISSPCIRRHGFPTSRQPGRAQNRGAKRKSAVTLDDFPTFPVTPVATDPLLTNDDENSKFKVKVKKLSTTVNFEDIDKLPQGLISFSLEPLPIEELEPALPTVLLQAHNNIRKFENCVLLTRVGGFYELYFEHADEFGPLLNLKVAQRKTGKKDSPNYVSMSGFPFFQLDRYLKILVQDLNRYVAIAEEFKNDAEAQSKSGGLLNDRRVTRIVTPGTLIDETFMDPFTNNYVLAVHAQEPSPDEIESTVVDESAPLRLQQPSMTIGLAWMDLSTGHFFTQKTELASLPSFLARIGPREIVLDESLRDEKTHAIFDVLADDQQIVTFASTADFRPMKDWSPMLESPITPSKAETFTHAEVAAGSILIQYVEERLQGSNMKLQPPTRQLDMMGIDKNTMRALEIKKTIRDEQLTGSLLHTVRRTVTKGGARLLDTWLSSPSTSVDTVNSRLDLVTYMLENTSLQENVCVLLQRSHDSHRLLQKFAFGRGDPDDLLALSATIYATRDLVTILLSSEGPSSSCVHTLAARIDIDGPLDLASRINEALDEDGVTQKHLQESSEEEEIRALASAVVDAGEATTPTKTKRKKPTSIREHYSDDTEAWIMRPAASETLQRLHDSLAELANEKIELTESLSARLEAPSLTLKFTPGLGHICHIKGKDASRSLGEGKRVSSSKSTTSFHHPSWSDLGARLDRCRDHIRAEEQRVFRELREQVILNIVKLRKNANVLDELDIVTSFAVLAVEKGWTRPVLNTTAIHKIVGGRHPTVEGGLKKDGRAFTSNDCFVGDLEKALLITGPNMAGKSTFLRQNALITILAQVGSYIPAQYAEIGIVDQIFSRVGSADNLYKDQSTFMVEMLETATILKHATSKSFVIMDEIGRGTTPSDGTAVAFACLHYLYNVNKCRTLFATHFHSLADMAIKTDMEGVGFYCTDVKEDDEGDGFRYVHKLREGINRSSHALKVARLAGLPEEAIGVAKDVLEKKI